MLLLLGLLLLWLLYFINKCINSSEKYEEDSCTRLAQNGYFIVGPILDQKCRKFVSLCGDTSNLMFFNQILSSTDLSDPMYTTELQKRMPYIYDSAIEEAQDGICP